MGGLGLGGLIDRGGLAEPRAIGGHRLAETGMHGAEARRRGAEAPDRVAALALRAKRGEVEMDRRHRDIDREGVDEMAAHFAVAVAPLAFPPSAHSRPPIVIEWKSKSCASQSKQ